MAAGVKTGGRQKGTRNKPKAPTDVTVSVTASDVIAHARQTADPAFPKYRTARVDSLVPYVNNARTHSPAQISKIAASIKEFGFTNPILTDGKRGIVAGHGRLLAAQKLGMESVPTLELSHLSAAQRRAYVIADNRLALDAGWDDELLALELGELRDEGFNLELTGFDLGELKLMFGDEGSAGLTDPDDVPPTPAVPVSLLGDVWVMGKHRLVCGDSRDVLPTLTGIDAVVTDPPYGIGLKPNTHSTKANDVYSGGAYHTSFDPILNDSQVLDPVFLLKFPCVLWGANNYAARLPASNGWLCWYKDGGIKGFNMSECELAWTSVLNSTKHISHMWHGFNLNPAVG